MKVYIACPAYAVSGGAELLHQLSFALKNRNIESYMVYYGVKENETPTPARYMKYEVSIAEEYVDSDDAVFVLPEVGVHEVDKCVKGKAAVWWLSVNNYIMCYKQQFKTTFDIFGVAKRKNVYHFVQSQYAKDFLFKFFKINESFFLSDYINDEILAYGLAHIDTDKENICVYNPAKGLANIEPLIAKGRKDVQWIALQGFTPAQMAEVLNKAKVYVDFGGHPGKDRIPREAAICGCCVITNREGSAANGVDVIIPEKYKFAETSDYEEILTTIYDLIDNYDDRKNIFNDYRQKIVAEKKEFENEVDEFIRIINQQER